MGIDVAILGYGAIGRSVHLLLAQHPQRVRVLGVLDRAALAKEGPKPPRRSAGPPEARVPVLDLPTAIKRADLVIECASPSAVRAHGPEIIAADTDLLVASLGALVDARLGAQLHAGPGRCHLSTGAIGGLDLIRAAAGTLEAIELETVKLPAALLHPGLSGTQREDIERAQATGSPVLVFSGSVSDAVAGFPSNINVAAALGLAAGDLSVVRVSITADPTATLTSHTITVRGETGNHRFELRNFPDPANPASSALTARAIASGVLRLAGVGPHFI